MPQLATLALHHRDHLSEGKSRRIYGYEAYHWSIIITPEEGRDLDWKAYDATDACHIDPETFRMTNPNFDWQFRAQPRVDPENCTKVIGRLVIGCISDKVSADELHRFFRRIPLPVRNSHPQQSCVTWAERAIIAMQEEGWARTFDVEEFKDAALAYADDRINGEAATEPSVKEYTARS